MKAVMIFTGSDFVDVHLFDLALGRLATFPRDGAAAFRIPAMPQLRE
jgi:hypothetical protein